MPALNLIHLSITILSHTRQAHHRMTTWKLTTPTTIKNCFVRYDFSTDHVSSNEDTAVKLGEDEEDYWQSFQTLEVQFED
jgi:hypothetical protein